MPVMAILISGSMGCGKTTVLGEASDILSKQSIPHGVVDLDAIGTVLLPDDAARDLTLRNLAAIYGNFVAAGITHVLLAQAVETHEELQRLRQILAGAELAVCRLTAGIDTMERRLRIREPGMHQELFVARSRRLQETLENVKLEDYMVLNDGRTVTEVAREVLHRAGWIP
jgi:hypothetical protein